MKRRESGGNTLPDADEDRLLRVARDRVRSAYPNPNRAGCPGRERLEALARDECRPADEVEDLKHVVTCSPCFAEYDAIRTAWRRRRSMTLAGVADTAVAVMVSIGVFFLNHRTAVVHAPPATKKTERLKQVAGILGQAAAQAVHFEISRPELHQLLDEEIEKLMNGGRTP